MSERTTGGGKYSGTGDKPDLDNHSKQCNPNNPEYRGYTKEMAARQTWTTTPNNSTPTTPYIKGKNEDKLRAETHNSNIRENSSCKLTLCML